MKEYRVEWTLCPTAYNPTRVLYVTAGNEADAEAIAKDHIERKLGIGGWIKYAVSEPPHVPAGTVAETSKI